MAVGEGGDTLALGLETLAALIEILPVDFAAPIVVTHLVGCNAARLTAHHGIEDAPALFGERAEAVGI